MFHFIFNLEKKYKENFKISLLLCFCLPNDPLQKIVQTIFCRRDFHNQIVSLLISDLYLVAGVEAVGDCVLVDVEGGQPQGELVLELGGEPLLGDSCDSLYDSLVTAYLGDVVAALDVEVLEGHRVRPQQLVRIGRDEGDAEQAAEVVSPGPGGDLDK